MNTNSGGDDRNREREAFNQHLEHASKIVESWPAWKQEVLGKSNSDDSSKKHCT